MKVMFDAIDANRSPAEADGVPSISPDTVRVGVYNGTFEPGAAHEAAGALEEALSTPTASLEVADVANAPRFNFKRHLIRYNKNRPETRALAELVAAALPRTDVVSGKTGPGLDVAVIVGSRPFKTKKIVQILPIPLPPPSALPEECR
jgi:hypothetical protein